MSYIAEPKEIEVLGQKFQSFLDESGNVVFSQTSAAKGLNLTTPYRITEIQASKSFKAICSKDFEIRKTLKTTVSPRAISVVTMSELTELVNYLASRGDDRAVAMQQASFATVLQMSVDTAYGVSRDRQEYVDAATQAAKWLEERRKELRKVSYQLTNPTIACNLYQYNNELVYGLGINRDTYEGEDVAHKHFLVTTLESLQAGLKLAGLSIEDIKERSIDIYNNRIARMNPIN